MTTSKGRLYMTRMDYREAERFGARLPWGNALDHFESNEQRAIDVRNTRRFLNEHNAAIDAQADKIVRDACGYPGVDKIARDIVRRDAEAREQLAALSPANAWPDFIGRGRDWAMFGYGVACGAVWVCIALALWALR